MLRKLLVWPFILWILTSCSSKEMKQESYALSELPASMTTSLKDHEKSFILVGLNDLNSQLNGIHSQGISIGGIEMIERYLNIIDRVFEDKNLILSTGHLTQEQSSSSQVKAVYQAMDQLPLNGLGVSARELKTELEMESPLINSNVFEISSRSLIENEHMKPYRIFEKGGLKVGVLSVTPPDPKEVLNGLYFEDAVASILKSYQRLENEGVDLVTLISHFPSECETSSPQFKDDHKLECPEDSPLKKLLERLPAHEIDLVITTGQRFSFGKIGDVYVMNTPGNGLYLDLIRVVYNEEKKKVDHKKTVHYGPILLCKQFFKLTKDCFIGNSNERYQKLQDNEFAQMPAQFLGIPVINK